MQKKISNKIGELDTAINKSSMHIRDENNQSPNVI